MKQITMEEAVRLGAEQEEVFMMIRIRPTTMIEELAAVDGFCTTEPESPEKKKRNNRVDHGLKPKAKRLSTMARSLPAIVLAGLSLRSLMRLAALSRL